jgi:hypothetical protein
MAGEIQIGGTTFATESNGTVTVSNVDSATNRQNLGLEIGVDVQSHDADTTKNDVANTFTANQIISVTDNTNAALRVTQLGTGNALVVEDSTNPDSTPFVVDSSGNVGVGSSPAFKLDVIDSSAPTVRINDGAPSGTRIAGRLLLGASSTLGVAVENSVSSFNDNCSMVFKTTPSSGTITQVFIIDSSGNVGAPSGSNIYSASDQRLKQNITDLSGCLQKVLLMRGVSFNWIDKFCDSEADRTLYGLIAQELRAVDSNLVDSFSDNKITAGEVTVENPLRVNEKFIIPMLVESIKEQQTIIESQQSQIDALTAKTQEQDLTIASLISRIEALEIPAE